MLEKRSPQRELFRPDNSLIAHVGADSIYGFLARQGGRLFRDGDFADLYGKRGRPSVPPSQLCVLLTLQAREGVSDQEAVDRTAFDIPWKVALGVELEDKLRTPATTRDPAVEVLRQREDRDAAGLRCDGREPGPGGLGSWPWASHAGSTPTHTLAPRHGIPARQPVLRLNR